MTVIAIERNRLAEWARLAGILSKPRLTLMLVFTAAVAAVVASEGKISPDRLAVLMLAGLLGCAGAAWLNHCLDDDIDALMPRTSHRPFPQGRASARGVAMAGAALVAAGAGAGAAINLTVSACVLLGAATYAGVYTWWLKRRTAWNIVIGGAAGSFAVLSGWAAGENVFPLSAWILAGLVFLWTPAHFWSFAIVYENDYRRAGVPMLPVVVGARKSAWAVLFHASAVVIASLALLAVEPAEGWVYPVVALAGGAYFLGSVLRLVRDPRPRTAWQTFKTSNIYMGLLQLGLLAGVVVA